MVSISFTNDQSNPFNEGGFNVDFMGANQPTIDLPASVSEDIFGGFAPLGTRTVQYMFPTGVPGLTFAGTLPVTVTGTPNFPGSQYVENFTTTYHLDQGSFTIVGLVNGALEARIGFGASLPAAEIDGRTFGSFIANEALVYGSNAPDVLAMTDFAEAVYGGSGNDTLLGRGGNDLLFGGYDEKDRLSGGPGSDTLEDGRYYVFDAALGPDNVDHISYFSIKVPDDEYSWGDKIELDRDVFGKLKVGKLKAKFFDAGNKKADDPDDYLVYHRKSGGLYYDADGSRSKHGPILFAILDNKPKDLSHKDFVIFDDG